MESVTRRPMPRTVPLFGIDVANIERGEALDSIVDWAHRGCSAQVAFVNAHCLNTACDDRDYRAALRRSDLILPDGTGVRWAMRAHGVTLRENLNGTDLFPHLCRRLADQGLSMFLLGARPGVARRVAERMQREVPGLRIAGVRDGYFDADAEAGVVEEINRSGAQVLLCAMGVPRQELWLDRHRETLTVPVRIAVGGLFDFYSGRIPRAPRWLRGLGMEWLWRLAQEPRRMWRRYVVGNPRFLHRVRRSLRPAPLPAAGARAALRRHWWATRATRTGVARRALDIAVSATLLALLSPLLAATALAIRLESPGPVLFSQTRVGHRGVPFRFWKFRSMHADAEARRQALLAQNEMQGGVLFKMRDDPRITRVGRFIRRYSIDELPQLWNVLRGDMALVGPRPALPDEVAQYRLSDRRRLDAEPGITCLWQVSGRSELPFERQVELDVAYLHDARLGQDLHLLLRTVPAVLSARGAR